MTISLAGVSLSLHGMKILEDVSFTISDGDFTSLVGPNGSGKSTVIRAIVGHAKNYKGYISEVELQHICYLPQGLEDPPFLTVREVGTLGFYGQDKGVERERVLRELLDICGLSSIANSRFEDISAGQKQRAWLAFALAQGKGLIIMDEPLSSVDLESRERFYSLLRDIADMGKTLLVVTHDVDMAVKYSDRLVILNKGRVAFSGTTGEYGAANGPP